MATITGYVTIRNFQVFLDREAAFPGAASNEPENFLQHVYESLNISYPKFFKMDPLSGAGFLAAEILLKQYPLDAYAPVERAVILANAHGCLETDMRYHEASKTVSSPALFVYTLPNIVAGEICIRHGMKGENAFFISEKLDAGLLHDYVHQVLHYSPAKACVAGWVDVIGAHHDVLLYLIEKQSRGMSLPHTAEQLNELYHH